VGDDAADERAKRPYKEHRSCTLAEKVALGDSHLVDEKATHMRCRGRLEDSMNQNDKLQRELREARSRAEKSDRLAWACKAEV
jgi:hypothetical protein